MSRTRGATTSACGLDRSSSAAGRTKPLIVEVKGNSLDDGPGIRSVVFFKGCPLSCVWCHNPEGRRPTLELAYDVGECIDCGTCSTICNEGALSRRNPFFVDRTRCNLCLDCTEVCPSGALSRVGEVLSVDDIVVRVIEDKPFFDTSGGGVTLSGGEPTLFMEFVAQLLDRLQAAGIHTLIETCGLFDPDAFIDRIEPLVDTIYFDIKIIDAADHKRFCGRDNRRILANFELLYGRFLDGGTTVVPRMPLIPGITDTAANVSAVAALLNRCGASSIELLAYHPTWREKTAKLGLDDELKDHALLHSFLTSDQLERCRSIFNDAGIRA